MLARFIQSESAGGIVLMAAAALALAIANSPFAPAYFDTLSTQIAGMSLLHWVNDGLMALFFLFVGLEIKREFLKGHLSSWKSRMLPGIAALGGVLVPALIYASLNAENPETLRGWAIPTATDIAFALGILSLLGPRVPASLKVFLAALAIIDDLIAVVVIALFYTASLSMSALGGAMLATGLLIAMNLKDVKALTPYLIVGAILWVCTLQSGIHATIAGVVLALTIPITSGANSPLHKLEHALAKWIAFLVVPVFGFANAGVSLSGIGPEILQEPVVAGIALGLFAGKQIGVFGTAFLAITFKLATMPEGANWRQIYGISLLCGIGFTMSLFIGLLSFVDPALQDMTKIGVLAGSILSGVCGYFLLKIRR